MFLDRYGQCASLVSYVNAYACVYTIVMVGLCVWSLLCCSLPCALLGCNYLDGEERAGCLTLTVFLMSCDSVLRLFPALSWAGLQCVIVVFSDHSLALRLGP